MAIPVVLYVPNLIGYTRIILGVAAFAFVRNPLVFIALYFTSQGLDAVDGVCARACNQSGSQCTGSDAAPPFEGCLQPLHRSIARPG
jgi:phosphatidylserine synthase